MNTLNHVGVGIYLALQNTPLWVYLLFAYLLFVGIKAARGGVVPLAKMFFMPILFTIMSLETIYRSFSTDFLVVLVFMLSLVVAIGLGIWQAKKQKPKPDHDRKRLYLPGSWVTLYLVFIVFFSKYYFSYELAVDPSLAHNNLFEFSLLVVSGLATGLFIGRTAYYYWVCQHGPWTQLDD